jgi:xanthine dehydrogenase YagT iron-sulfur-binding subunit
VFALAMLALTRLIGIYWPGSTTDRSGDGGESRNEKCSALIAKPQRTRVVPIIINGSPAELPADPRVSLLDLLREHLKLTGTKIGCNQGACGACTVLVDGQRMLSCLALAIQYEGSSVITIEGLSAGGVLHPLQQAFVEHDGFQCGYCTPGQVCSAIGMAEEINRGVPSLVTADLSSETIELTHDELRERMSGNLCRCGAYNGIVDAVTAIYAGPVP